MPTSLHTTLLDGRGGATEFGPGAQLEAVHPEGSTLWVHLDYAEPESASWLRTRSGIDPLVISALLSQDPRPRSLTVGEGLLVVLRGVNVNEGANPEDMVSLRMWFEAGRVFTLRHRPLAAVRDVAAQLRSGAGPVDSGDLLHAIIQRLLDRIGLTVQQLEDTVDDLEAEVVGSERRALRTRLSELRRQSIALRRYLAPQRETIVNLQFERVPWLTDLRRAQLREAGDRVTRYVETLDAARERAAVTSEELSNRLAEQMNQTMYVLSVVTAIFLPLGLLTGLLGINVGGMPGTDYDGAFALVTLVLVVLGLGQWWWYRTRNLL